jgi:hypothetical protein
MGGDFTEGGQSTSPGIYTYAIADVFNYNKQADNKAKGLTVSVSFFEIYGVKVNYMSFSGEYISAMTFLHFWF